MKIGIIWLPNVGKSTLFNALTQSYAADAANFPFCTIEPNIGIVDVKDERIDILANIYGCTKLVYAATKFVDIAGLVKGASTGEGLGNKFLSHIREVDAIIQVVRYFDDPDVVHVHGEINPIYDADIINSELMIADLDHIQKQLPALSKLSKKTREQEQLVEVLTLGSALLNQGLPLSNLIADLNPEQVRLLQSQNFLTTKPLIYAVNIAESDLMQFGEIEKNLTNQLQKPVIAVSAKLESEMMELDDGDKAEYIKSIFGGYQGEIPTLDRLIKLAYDTVGLMYYFTSGEKETKAWSIPVGSTAPQAAWAIHTDFERGFIKAEIVGYTQLIAAWSRSKAKEAGHLRLEGKEYIVQDGDVIIFRFNV